MKILLTLFLSLYTYIALSQSNNGYINPIICTYNLTYRTDSTSNDTKEELMTLTINQDYSKFESNNSHLSDSIVASPSFDQSSLDILASHGTSFTYKIYKFNNNNNNNIKYFDKIGQKQFTIKQSNIPMTWGMTLEKKVIAGFNCQKATTTYAGRKWQAWFTKEVPVSDGPYKFTGLPGLIIELSDVTNSYVFRLINLKKINHSVKLDIPTNVIETSFTQYNKAKADYFYNGVSQITKQNSPNNYNKEMEEYKQKQAKKNNPIELE